MIIKSFYKKKITKIYLLIYFLIFVVFGIVFMGKRYYMGQVNENYGESFIYVLGIDEDNLKMLPNIKSYEKAIWVERFIVKAKESLSEKEMLLPNTFYDYNVGGNYDFVFGDNTYNFTIKDFYETDESFSYVYISEKKLDKIIKENTKYSYIIYVNNWLERTEIIDVLEKQSNVELRSMEVNKANVDLTSMISTFELYTYVIIGVFIIVCIITIINIVNDEKKKIFIYRSIGYSKKKILKLQILNIVSLFFISFILSFFAIIWIKFFFNL